MSWVMTECIRPIVYFDEFQYSNNFGFGGNYIFDYTTLSTSITQATYPVANPNITWEVANNNNIGIEGTLGGGKITFELDYFNNLRSQMLIPSVCIYSSYCWICSTKRKYWKTS